MIIRSASFVTSSARISQLPPPDRPEYAFIGRSNVGKSSLINMLVSKKGLAKTSGSPGKTQTINHFIINESWYLVDLPGYGYARVSHRCVISGQAFTSYVTMRQNLILAFRAMMEGDRWHLTGIHERLATLPLPGSSQRPTTRLLKQRIPIFHDRVLLRSISPSYFVTSASRGTQGEGTQLYRNSMIFLPGKMIT